MRGVASHRVLDLMRREASDHGWGVYTDKKTSFGTTPMPLSDLVAWTVPTSNVVMVGDVLSHPASRVIVATHASASFLCAVQGLAEIRTIVAIGPTSDVERSVVHCIKACSRFQEVFVYHV
jgi:hypothetical protein